MPGMDRAVILIRNLTEATCAADASARLARPLALLSIRDGATIAGAGWFDAVLRHARRHAPSADLIGILDCGNRADLVQAAWRQGIEAAVYRGRSDVRQRLQGIADVSNRILLGRRPRAFEFGRKADLQALSDWLSRQPTPS